MKSVFLKCLHRITNITRALTLAIPLALSLQSPSALANGNFSAAELDQMLAPIALYPDTILSQVLIASTYPLEIIQADRWARSNTDLKPEDALKFTENKDWDPSVRALVAFPDILKRMSDDIDWTQRLGDAFLSDEAEVMDTVQKLRKRAYASGNLENNQHMRVERERDVIVIEPIQERVVYVPSYDTRVVYGSWWWPEYPPVFWGHSSYHYVSGFYWGSSIYVGSSYYSSACHWHDRRVVVVDRYQPYYYRQPFYTSRSIVAYDRARPWQHEPIHRHGVAYANDNLRTVYGSSHNSYERDRDYRDRYRDMSRIEAGRNIRVAPSNTAVRTIDTPRAREARSDNRTYDRSEAVRERLNTNPTQDRVIQTQKTEANAPSTYDNTRARPQAWSGNIHESERNQEIIRNRAREVQANDRSDDRQEHQINRTRETPVRDREVQRIDTPREERRESAPQRSDDRPADRERSDNNMRVIR